MKTPHYPILFVVVELYHGCVEQVWGFMKEEDAEHFKQENTVPGTDYTYSIHEIK